MIASMFHKGSGLGNQLHRYVAARVLSLDKGCEFGMLYPGCFKGSSFMNLDMGGTPITPYPFQPEEEKETLNLVTFIEEKRVIENGVDIRGYDPEINLVEDKTIIEGEFQDPRYFEHRIDEVREWLKVEPLDMPDDLCVINFRGGEYVGVRDLFLPKEYWDLAVGKMKEINPNMRFEVHTDDIDTAQMFFPEYKCIQDIGLNWRSIRYAKYLILSNSSFAIFPALLGEAKEIVAPKYWAGYNKGFWQLQQNFYKRFRYIHHEDL